MSEQLSFRLDFHEDRNTRHAKRKLLKRGVITFMHAEQGTGPLVSLVVPVYNGANYIENLLEDVRKQDYCALEVIVVDDGSDDGTVGVVEHVADIDPRIKVACQGHRGVSAARNTGLALSAGDFIGFLDADDRIEPRFVGMLVAAAVQERAPLAVCGWDRGEGSKVMLPQTDATCAAGAMIGYYGFFSSLWNKLFARDVIFSDTSFAAFDESLEIGEDEEWLARVLLGCDCFALVPYALYHWLPRRGSATFDSDSLNARTMTEIRAKRLVYHHFSQRRDLQRAARRSYVYRMRTLLVKGYRAREGQSPLYQELLSEFMAATDNISGGGSTLIKARLIRSLIVRNAPVKLVEWVEQL